MLDYSEFRSEYEKQHPASVPIKPKQVQGEYPKWLRFVVLLMFVSSALISGVHTIPTVYEGIESSIAPFIRAIAAAGSFIAIEVSFFVSPFAQNKGDKRMSRAGLGVSFIIALAANVNSVLKAMASNDMNGLVTMVALIFGVGMPLLAFISGAMFVHMHTSASVENDKLQTNYRDECKQLDTTVLTAFRKYCKEMEGSKRSNGTSIGIPRGNFQEVIPSESTLGHKKQPNARIITEEYFDGNPGAINENPLELAERLGVGKSTVYTVRAERTQLLNGKSGNIPNTLPQ